MSSRKKQEKYLESATIRLETGKEKGKYDVSVEVECIGYTMSNLLSGKEESIKPTEKSISTAGFQAINNERISEDKSNTYKENTLNTQCARNSVVASTSRGKSYVGFWKSATTDWSRKLWLPTGIDCVESHGTTSSGCSISTESISWSTVRKIALPCRKWPRTSCPSSTFTLVDTTVKGGEQEVETHQKTKQKTQQMNENKLHARKMKKNPKRVKCKIPLPASNYIPKARVISVVPTVKQKRVINDWIAASRKTWNLAIHDMYTTGDLHPTETSMRNKFVIKKNMSNEYKTKYEWLFRTPKRIREYAVKDLVSSVKACYTKIKKQQIRKFKIHTKSSTSTNQTINLPKESSYYYQNEHKLRVCGQDLRLKEHPFDINTEEKKIPILCNMRLTRKDGAYYLCVPVFTDIHQSKYYHTPSSKIVSIDPGINTFMTYYTPDYECGFIGNNLKSELLQMHEKEKKIKASARISKENKARAIRKIHYRIKNIIDDLHWKLSHYLLRRYGKILIPRLYVQKGYENKLLQSYMKHCLFVDRLVYKSMFYREREVHEVQEHWTSKTCTRCGKINYKLGSSREFVCSGCGLETHRDIAAARNILLKHLC